MSFGAKRKFNLIKVNADLLEKQAKLKKECNITLMLLLMNHL